MPKYENGKIYRIICNQTGLQYIGSTTISLSARLSQHKKILKDGKSGTSKIVLQNGDYNIVLLQDFPCDRKEQLLQRERYYIETMDCVNKKIPNRTKKEWYEGNKKEYIARQMIWNNNNKEKLVEYKKTFKNKNTQTNIDVEDENFKFEFDEIYDFPKETLLEIIDNKINNNK